MAKKAKKVKKLTRPATWSPPSGENKRSKVINKIVVGGVTLTMIIVLLITVAPQNPGNQAAGAGSPGAGNEQRTVVDNTVQQQIASLEREAKNNPKDVRILTSLANLYYDTGQWAQASQRYAQALDITPENTDVRTDLGVAYYYQGKNADAIREYNKALEYEPSKRQTLLNLGIALATGPTPDPEGAIAKWQKIIELYPDTDDAKKAQEKIAQLKK